MSFGLCTPPGVHVWFTSVFRLVLPCGLGGVQGFLLTPGMQPVDLKRFFWLMRSRPRLQSESLTALSVSPQIHRTYLMCALVLFSVVLWGAVGSRSSLCPVFCGRVWPGGRKHSCT